MKEVKNKSKVLMDCVSKEKTNFCFVMYGREESEEKIEAHMTLYGRWSLLIDGFVSLMEGDEVAADIIKTAVVLYEANDDEVNRAQD